VPTLVLGLLVLLAIIWQEVRLRRAQVAMGADRAPIWVSIAKLVVLGAVVIGASWLFATGRVGTSYPIAGIILGIVAVGYSFLSTNTTIGRHIYAIGGNAEAARRAGIRVDRIRTIVFMLASLMAAWGGIMAASRLLAVNQSSGGGDLLLMSIAGPVVAGVSLFGGRGSVWGALLGALVIVSISNGMDLLALDTAVKFMVTGGVLLAAVALDAVTRSRRRSAGRA